jgi:hypothetical protein
MPFSNGSSSDPISRPKSGSTDPIGQHFDQGSTADGRGEAKDSTAKASFVIPAKKYKAGFIFPSKTAVGALAMQVRVRVCTFVCVCEYVDLCVLTLF